MGNRVVVVRSASLTTARFVTSVDFSASGMRPRMGHDPCGCYPSLAAGRGPNVVYADMGWGWPWSVPVMRDLLPSSDIVDLPLMDKLNENSTLIRRYPKTFYMCFLDFMKFTDSFKVKVRERTLAEGEIPLLTETADMVVPPSAQTICIVNHTIVDELKEITGKKKRKSGQHDTGYESVVPHTEEFVYSSVTPTPERDYQDESISAHDENVRTRPALDRFVVLTSSSEHADTHTLNSPHVASPTPYVQSESKAVAAGMVNEVEGSSVLGNQTGTSSSAPGDASRNLVDHVPPPGYWASLCNQNDLEFLDRLNVNSAQHACMVSELHFRYEHEITIRERFEKKFVESSGIIQQRDIEIADLKSRLERPEGKAAEVGKFCGQVSRLEVAAAAKAEQFVGLSVQNTKLLGQVSSLESVRDGLKEKVAQLESECECLRGKVEGEAKLKERFLADVEIQRLAKRGSDLDAHLSKLSYQTDLATVISLAINQGIQQGLEVGIEHRKVRRELGAVATYDPGVKAKYEEAVGELENILLPFLDRMESYKDAPLEHIMASLYLEFLPVMKIKLLSSALEDSRPRAQKYKRDASSSLVVAEPIASSPYDSSLVPVIEECGTSSSLAATVTPLSSLAVTNYPISDVSMVKNVAYSELQNLSSTHDQQMSGHDDMFDTTLLDKLEDHQLYEPGSS
ncbi:hypothetical protein Tco_1081292 [Tanacetum coccineum]|uniref:Transposase (Putative), gypsy type n=1 Tax=Tanacetum coccineum TaxID=301880 RepID=A0ABQ5HX46_9ASTR